MNQADARNWAMAINFAEQRKPNGATDIVAVADYVTFAGAPVWGVREIGKGNICMHPERADAGTVPVEWLEIWRDMQVNGRTRNHG